MSILRENLARVDLRDHMTRRIITLPVRCKYHIALSNALLQVWEFFNRRIHYLMAVLSDQNDNKNLTKYLHLNALMETNTRKSTG
jgi:hypothetical protein